MTYPWPAQTSGFHRYDHESVQAPCGPPWMKKIAGYFLDGSKPAGRTTQACSLRPSAESVVRSETSPIAAPRKSSSLKCVNATPPFPSAPIDQISAARASVLWLKKRRRPSAANFSPEAPPPRQISTGAPPEIATRKTALRPATWLSKAIADESGDQSNSSTQLSSPSVK